MGDPSSESSSEDSAGVRRGGRGMCSRCSEKREVCMVVGEVRKGKVRGFYGRISYQFEVKMGSELQLPCGPSSFLASHLHPRLYISCSN